MGAEEDQQQQFSLYKSHIAKLKTPLNMGKGKGAPKSGSDENLDLDSVLQLVSM